MGPQQLGQKSGEVFLGREFGHQPNYSEQVAASIDAEVRRLIDEAHQRARAILTLHRETLDRLAAALVETETLDTPELMAIIGPLGPWVENIAAAANGNGHAGHANGNGNGNGNGARPATVSE